MKIFRIAAVSTLLIGVVSLAGQKPKSDPPKSLEVVAIATGSGDPIAGARVTLLKNPGITTRSGSNPGSDPPPELNSRSVSAVAYTDATGRFTFTNIDPKVYGLVVGANGYVRQELKREDFPETGKPFVVRMKATGSVFGVVRGPSGRPLADASVQLLRYVYGDNGQRTLTPFGLSRTNDRGEYRLHSITPGRYYIRAGRISKPIDNDFNESVLPLFYPGVGDIAQASIVVVESAGVVGGVDFNLKRQEAHRIRGRIIDQAPNGSLTSGKGPRMFYLGGGFSTSSDVGNYWAYTVPSASGSFEIRNIVSGTYAIAYGDNPVLGLVPVRVGESDIEGIEVALNRTTLSGQVRIEGGAVSKEIQDNTRFHLSLVLPGERLTENNLLWDFSTLGSTDFDENGKFIVEDVLPLEYRFETGWLPSGSYVKSARFGGVDVLRQPFYPGSGGSTLEIVIAMDSGSVAAAVVDEKSKPIYGAQVVLVPERERERADHYLTAKADRAGKVDIKGIPPGDYKLFAWESIEENSWFDPEVIRQFEAKAKSIHVGTASSQTMELRVIPESK
jgi:hypothetical protein